MKICEVVPKKPLTPEQSRIRSLKLAADNARAALQREREQQKQKRERERLQR